MIFRDTVFGVLQHKGQVNVVPRAPYIPLAVKEPFQAIVHALAARVELIGG